MSENDKGVLSVLDSEIRRAGGAAYPAGRDLIQARDTVRELIEAAERAHAFLTAQELSHCVYVESGRMHKDAADCAANLEAALSRANVSKESK